MADIMAERQGSIGAAITWMLLISLLLFWLPVLGGLIAGFVGGRKAGSVGSAVLAVFLPAIVVFWVMFLLGASLVGVPLIGFIAGMGGLVLSLMHVGPLLIGAIFGGASA